MFHLTKNISLHTNTPIPLEYTRTYEDIYHMYLVNTDVHMHTYPLG